MLFFSRINSLSYNGAKHVVRHTTTTTTVKRTRYTDKVVCVCLTLSKVKKAGGRMGCVRVLFITTVFLTSKFRTQNVNVFFRSYSHTILVDIRYDWGRKKRTFPFDFETCVFFYSQCFFTNTVYGIRTNKSLIEISGEGGKKEISYYIL